MFSINRQKTFFIISILLIATILRILGLNFEDYWIDEQISFWISDPNINFSTFVNRVHEYNDGSHYPFLILLRIFFKLFGYNPEIGRILPMVFNILSIPAIGILAYQIKKNNGYFLTIFLASINFYLISYSQELRVYSLLYFISILNIIFFFQLIKEKKNKIWSLLYVATNLFGLFSHIFFLIIILSQATYVFINYFSSKKNFFTLVTLIGISILFYIFIGYDSLIIQLSKKDFWINQIKLDFFYNYFFSRFFGSKIMGLIYLSILLYVIFYSKKKIFNFSEKYFLLIIILLFSYILPLLYGFIKFPILIDRYIIFILIPIFLLISIFILEIENNKIKNCMLILLLFSSLINNYIEIFNRKISKPEFRKTLKIINNSNTKYISTNTPERFIEIVDNYIKSTKEFNNLNIISLKNIDNKIKNFWLICYEPLASSDCSLPSSIKNTWNEKDSIKYHLITAKLLSRK
jgi:uncharacterized membrane protein